MFSSKPSAIGLKVSAAARNSSRPPPKIDTSKNLFEGISMLSKSARNLFDPGFASPTALI
jgi:hypothetical protein